MSSSSAGDDSRVRRPVGGRFDEEATQGRRMNVEEPRVLEEEEKKVCRVSTRCGRLFPIDDDENLVDEEVETNRMSGLTPLHLAM